MRHLQRIGRVLHTTSNKNIIVKANGRLPKIGLEAVDENLKVIGEIFDIIGPVSSPYISIRPKTTETANLMNKTVYVVVPSHKKGGNRRK